MIPASKREAVARALQQTFGTAAADDISLVAGGLSPALVFKIRVHGRPYLLRLGTQVDGLNDPARHLLCLNLAATAGVAPPVLYASAEDALVITAFISAQPLAAAPLRPGLVNMIRAIHALPLFPKVVDSMDAVDLAIDAFHASELLPESATIEHFKHYAEIQRAYPRHDPCLVSSHNDLNPNNILFDGTRLWAVDWDTAFANDCYVDLATVANYFVSLEDSEHEFLNAYFDGHATAYQRARFFLMRQVCHTFCAITFLRLAGAMKPAEIKLSSDMAAPCLRGFYALLRQGEVSLATYEGRLLYAKVLLAESSRMMKTPRFAESLGQM